jgi:hypothetical protein
VVIAGMSAALRPVAAYEAPAQFISVLGEQAVAVTRSDMPLATKARYFRQMIHRDFDLTDISRLVLGP